MIWVHSSVPRSTSYHLFNLISCGRGLFLINLKGMFGWFANGRSVLIERRLKNLWPLLSLHKDSLLLMFWYLASPYRLTRLRRWMLIASNPYCDLWASRYLFPRAATTVCGCFACCLNYTDICKSKLWILSHGPNRAFSSSLHSTFFFIRTKPIYVLVYGLRQF